MIRSYVISVSLAKGCYRHIRIPATATLYQLHKAILAAFAFEDDHAHAFFMDNCCWSPADPYFSMKMRGDEILTTKRTLKKLNLHKGDKFKYVFDFGDEWRFQCKVLQELEEETLITAVIRAVGDAPEQYPELSEDECGILPETYEKEEIIRQYAQLNLPEELIVDVHDYFEAAANLYGIISLGDLLNIFNQQNQPLFQEDFLAIAEVIRHEPNDFFILGAEVFYGDVSTVPPIEREIIQTDILECDPEDYYRLSDMRQGKSYAILPREQFLRYKDPCFMPLTPQSSDMLKFLKKRQSRLHGEAEEVLYSVYAMMRMDWPMQETVDGFEKFGFSFKGPQEIFEFARLYQEMSNHTRKIANRGMTPAEMREEWETVAEKKYAGRFAMTDPNQLSLFEKDKS